MGKRGLEGDRRRETEQEEMKAVVEIDWIKVL